MINPIIHIMSQEYELLSFVTCNKIYMENHLFDILEHMYFECNRSPKYLMDRDKSYMYDNGYYRADFFGTEIINCFLNKQLNKSLIETYKYTQQAYDEYLVYYMKKYRVISKLYEKYMSHMAIVCKMHNEHINSQLELLNVCFPYNESFGDYYPKYYYDITEYLDIIRMHFFAGYKFYSQISDNVNYLIGGVTLNSKFELQSRSMIEKSERKEFKLIISGKYVPDYVTYNNERGLFD